MTTKVTQSNFRIREYHLADGSTQEVFGNEDGPADATLVSDTMIEQTTKRTPTAEVAPPAETL